MREDTSEKLREMVTLLRKRWWLLTIRIEIPDYLHRDTVRKALEILAKVNTAASKIVRKDIQQAQRMIRCCLRDVQHLVAANIP